jgi:peptide-methionine (R)-S-oxide reductase
MKKRYLLQLGAATVGTVILSRYLSPRSQAQTASSQFEIVKPDAEWRRLLTSAQFNVLRQHGTEPTYSSPLDKYFVDGIYACAGCNLPVFSSDTKFDSGTGWPSFYQPIQNAVGTSEDHTLMISRTEVHCRRCGGHLGHVFDDGPPPTGQRYCINGVALKFIAS